MKEIKLVLNMGIAELYNDEYFANHPRAKKKRIPRPIHPSINTYMTMNNMAANNLKQTWKDFIVWYIMKKGLENLCIEKCEMDFKVYFNTNRRHDLDNISPKYIMDGLVEAGFIVDDDALHVRKLSLECDIDKENPRTEIVVRVIE